MQKQSDQDTENHRAQDAALQAYLDLISELLLENRLRSDPESVAQTVARARTIALLLQLDRKDWNRKGVVVRFLYEANLVCRGASTIRLASANLRYADLERSDLRNIDLSYADLYGANLSKAVLQRATLEGANLTRANLTGANLTGACLRGSVLSQALLGSADLREAENLVQEQITQGIGDQTTQLPDHIQYPEAWSKSIEKQTQEHGH